MKTRKGLIISTLAFALLANGIGASAQETQKKADREPVERRQEVIINRSGGVPARMPVAPGAVWTEGGGSDNFVFVSSEMSFDGKVVKGAPYSAQAVTETVQTLGDGNRIVRKTTANVYRDSEGRTRRDQTLGSIGPFAAAGDPPQTFFINDPVAKVNYILDPRSKTARKLPRFEFEIGTRFKTAANGKESFTFKFETKDKELKEKVGEAKIQLDRQKGKDGEAPEVVFTAPVPPGPGAPPDVVFYRHPSSAETKTEKLESRDVEGVQAEGTRTTTTIPAGEIGNEQPIVITNERWYSPELQTVVMTRHSDPRSGETTYRLTGINRSEPAATLFQVPSDYTVKEGPSFMRAPRPARKPAEN
ncbi:MAG TPA: hypothetical protein VM934_15510 [Pyrinomonadaceae bacterium]|jgi:hypothetical protein|nr:hypothetical protein [Pyrinomonadaceae bacterium]